MMLWRTSCRFLLFGCLILIPSRAPALFCGCSNTCHPGGLPCKSEKSSYQAIHQTGGSPSSTRTAASQLSRGGGSGGSTILAFAAAAATSDASSSSSSSSSPMSPRRESLKRSVLWTATSQPQNPMNDASSTTTTTTASSSSSRSCSTSDAELPSCPIVPSMDHVVSMSNTLENNPSQQGKVSDAYHLIWSPHVIRKVMITTPLLFLVQYLLGTTFATRLLGVRVHAMGFCWHSLVPGWMNQWMLPLLASSCCVLQLALNLISVGCAGFNTYLGPIRPYFLSLFVVLFTTNATASSHVALRRLLPLSSVVRVGVVFLPELVHVYNTWNSQRRVAKLRSDSILTNPKTDLSLSGATFQARVELDIPTMGCVACINAIDATLQQQSNAQAKVIKAASSLHPLGQKGGSAIVQVVGESQEALMEWIQQLPTVTERIGFGGATIVSVRHSKIESETTPPSTVEL